MIKKVAIIGTHSAGKTTLSYILAAKYKKLGKSVKIIQEVARSCPYKLNDGMTKEACLWIYHEHIKKELEAIQKFDAIICDRSVLDSFMYAVAQNCFDPKDSYMNLCMNASKQWMKTYDKIIYLIPGKIEILDDGFRSIDKDFQNRVKLEFDKYISFLSEDKNKITEMTSDDVFNPSIEHFEC